MEPGEPLPDVTVVMAPQGPARTGGAARGRGSHVPASPSARVLEALSAGGGATRARTFHRLLAATFLVAWISLGVQVRGLVGAHGLLPAGPFLAAIHKGGAGFADAPTWLALTGASDEVLTEGAAAGVALALIALLGVMPRLSFALQTVLYLGYVVAGRTFFSFQWDNLLLECGALAVLLPRWRRGQVAHVLFRVLLFKLYLESGLAKLESPLGDWLDGSAMNFYYETAPLPTSLAHFMNALPGGWHRVEGWLTLAIEIAVPFLVFAGRRPRLVTLVLWTGFQIVNIATANYGFFAYLAIALHVFLVDEADLVRVRRAIERRLGGLRRARVLSALAARARVRAARFFVPVERPGARATLRVLVATIAFGHVGVSLAEALAQFAGAHDLYGLVEPIAAFRLVNTYHLFASITTARTEPQIEVLEGTTWTRKDLRYKAGDLARAPGFVAPHQPRLDFQLWFYGLSFSRGTPEYVGNLVDRICHDPSAVSRFFRDPLPTAPAAVRISFERYHFTTRDELAKTGRWWKSTPVGATQPITCR